MPVGTMTAQQQAAGLHLARELLIEFNGDAEFVQMALCVALVQLARGFARQPAEAVENSIAILAQADCMRDRELTGVIDAWINQQIAKTAS